MTVRQCWFMLGASAALVAWAGVRWLWTRTVRRRLDPEGRSADAQENP